VGKNSSVCADNSQMSHSFRASAGPPAPSPFVPFSAPTAANPFASMNVSTTPASSESLTESAAQSRFTLPVKPSASSLFGVPADPYEKSTDPLANSHTFNRLFTFLIGPDETPFSVHQDIVGELSKPLHAMMTNGMEETVHKSCKLASVDVETFVLFLQYAYRGVYRAGNGCVLPQFDMSANPLSNRSYSGASRALYGEPDWTGRTITDVSGDKSDCTKLQSKSNKSYEEVRFEKIVAGGLKKVKRDFATREYPVGDLSHFSFRSRLREQHPTDAFTDTPVIHAKLYAFALEYLIELLQQQCLHKLHRDLIEMERRSMKMSAGIFDLFRCAFQATSAPDKSGKGIGSELRHLVVSYAYWKFEELSKSEDFLDFIAEVPDFARIMLLQLMEPDL
jgi:hypothetical protein